MKMDSKRVLLSGAVAGVLMAAAASQAMAATAEYDWASATSGDWATGTNWIGKNGAASGTAPTSGDATPAYINNGGTAIVSTADASGSVVTLGNGTNLSGNVIVNNGGIWTTSGAVILAAGASAYGSVTLNQGGTWNANSTVTVANSAGNSGDITVNDGGTLKVVTLIDANRGTGTITLNDGGTIETPDTLPGTGWKVQAGGTLAMNGGTFNYAPQATGQTLQVITGEFLMKGGTTTIGSTAVPTPVNITASGVVEIDGGTFSAPGNGYSINASTNGVFRVVGSASTITIGAFRSDTNNTGIFEFDLDNSANHITTITATGNSSATTAVARAGNLAVGLKGGVLLAGTNTFNLVSAASYTSNFATSPTNLWTEQTTGGLTQVVLNKNNADATALDPTNRPSDTFSAANVGYVGLTGIDTTQPLLLSLALTGGSGSGDPFSTVEAALTSAGITWAEESGTYNLQLTLNPAVSGATQFAWDFSTIDPSLNVQGIQLQQTTGVPEPASLALLGGAAMAFSVRRRRA